MKKIYTICSIFLLVLASQFVYSQQIGDLNGIYYQAVAIDENGKEIVGMDIEGKPLYNKSIGVRFTITKGLNGTIQWEETHSTNTDKYGLFTLTIGKGTSTGNGLYAKMLDIPWIDADQFLKVEISTKNDGNYKLVSNQQFMSVPYSFYTDDIADNAIKTNKILDETILAQDINTGAVATSEILNETILAEDINAGAVATSEILDETILAEDINAGAVATSEILNETILAEDINAGAVTTSEILDETILAEDINTGAVTTSEILDETILAEDINTGAVTSAEILNETILAEDISNGTIDLTTKVTNVLPVANGGTGNANLTANSILIGNGTGVVDNLGVATDGQIPIGVTGGKPVLANLTAGTGIIVTNTPGGIQIASGVQGVNSVNLTGVTIGNIPNGTTWVSGQPLTLNGVALGDIVIGSIDGNLSGCMLSCYVSGNNQIRMAIFNGTGGPVNLNGSYTLKVLVVK